MRRGGPLEYEAGTHVAWPYISCRKPELTAAERGERGMCAPSCHTGTLRSDGARTAPRGRAATRRRRRGGRQRRGARRHDGGGSRSAPAYGAGAAYKSTERAGAVGRQLAVGAPSTTLRTACSRGGRAEVRSRHGGEVTRLRQREWRSAHRARGRAPNRGGPGERGRFSLRALTKEAVGGPAGALVERVDAERPSATRMAHCTTGSTPSPCFSARISRRTPVADRSEKR